MRRTVGMWALPALVLVATRALAAEPATYRVTLGDDLFAAGNDVRVEQQVKGDAFLAGQRVDTSGGVGGDLIAAGTVLQLNGSIGDNVYGAGQRIELTGSVGRNARLAGGELHIAPAARIGGSLSLAARRIDFEGQSQGYLSAAGRSIRIDGHVGGDARIVGAELDVGPHAVIDGSLTFHGPKPPTVDGGARIAGGVHYTAEQIRYRAGRHRGVFGFGSWLFLIGWMIVGGLLLGIWPGTTRSVTDVTAQRALAAGLLGLAALIATPVVVVLLLITVIGIPLALLLLWVYLLVLWLGYLTAATTIADRLVAHGPGVAEATGRRVAVLIATLLVLFFVRRVPVLGPLVTVLLLLVGMGGILLAAGEASSGGSGHTTAPGHTATST
jgi:hypothetical protein